MNKIEFKKERDLGSIIGDTFAFIRENWKSYFLTVIKIAGPFILLGAFVLVLYLGSIGQDLQRIGDETNPRILIAQVGPLYAKMGVYGLVSGFVYLLISLTSIIYIKSYIDNDGVPNFLEIRRSTFKNIWKFIGLGLLIAVIVFVGAMFCLLPGIYFTVVFSIATSIMIFENKTIGETLSHSFHLIKDQWWNTFGCIVVIGILVTVLGWVFSVPTLIYALVLEMTGSLQQDPLQGYGMLEDPIYIGLNILSNVGAFILSSISLIASVFIYYDLNEQKNLTGTMERIDNLGQ